MRIASKRTALWVLLTAALGCGRSAAPQDLVGAAAEKNVVVVLFDAARADHFSFLGYERSTTPQLAEVARESVVFEQAYAQASATPLSVFSMFTSRYPIPDTGEHERDRDGEIAPMLLPGLPTIASTLRHRYESRVAFVSNRWVSSQLGYHEGFTEFHELWRTADSLERAAQTAQEVTDAVVAWLDNAGDKPFFAYVHYFEPHAPYTPPPPFDARFDPEARGYVDGSMESLAPYRRASPSNQMVARNAVALYDGNLAYADAQLGRLITALKDRGMWKNTVFVFLSDHGEAFWEHGVRGHGTHVYEEFVHVPLVVRVPGIDFLEGRRVSAPVQLVDLMPTLMELTGIPVPLRMTAGRSLLPTMREEPPEPSPSPVLLDSEPLAYMRNHVARDWEYGLRRGRFKFVYYFGRQPNELFDLRRDPRETVNLLEARMPPTDYDLETVTRALWDNYKQWVAGGHGVDSEVANNFSGIDSLDAETIERLRAVGYFH